MALLPVEMKTFTDFALSRREREASRARYARFLSLGERGSRKSKAVDRKQVLTRNS
jgi:hypothetical protein